MLSREEEFELFWSKCPRRVGKGAARRKFVQARRSVEFATLLHGMEAYAAWCARECKESQFICHPATWLHQERWDDEYDDPRDASDAAFDRLFERYEGGRPEDAEGGIIELDPTTRH